MANTFDPNLSTTKDKVRLLIGDTAAPWALDDETINAMLTLRSGSLYAAAISLCRSLVAKYTRLSSNATVGPFSLDYGSQADKYAALIEQLQADQRDNNAVAPYVSGFNKSDKTAQKESDAEELTHARIGIHDVNNEVDYLNGDYWR